MAGRKEKVIFSPLICLILCYKRNSSWFGVLSNYGCTWEARRPFKKWRDDSAISPYTFLVGMCSQLPACSHKSMVYFLNIPNCILNLALLNGSRIRLALEVRVYLQAKLLFCLNDSMSQRKQIYSIRFFELK